MAMILNPVSGTTEAHQSFYLCTVQSIASTVGADTGLLCGATNKEQNSARLLQREKPWAVYKPVG